MNFKFTLQKLRACIPNNSQAELWYEAFIKHLPKFQIDTVERVAGFISQCQHESNDFTILQENLNYSWQGLRRTFPRYFKTDEEAQEFHRQPERIANKVYANRMNNGNEASGDGWKFRGRGIIQITGRFNYTECSKYLFSDMTLVEDPELLRTPEYAVLSACWFWERNNLNSICDRKDIVLLSRRINGGTIGLDDRIKKWNRALNILDDNVKNTSRRILRIGMRGEDVSELQKKLGINADGIFGPNTERKLREWQAINKLSADGIAGPNTFRIMFG